MYVSTDYSRIYPSKLNTMRVSACISNVEMGNGCGYLDRTMEEVDKNCGP